VDWFPTVPSQKDAFYPTQESFQNFVSTCGQKQKEVLKFQLQTSEPLKDTLSGKLKGWQGQTKYLLDQKLKQRYYINMRLSAYAAVKICTVVILGWPTAESVLLRWGQLLVNLYTNPKLILWPFLPLCIRSLWVKECLSPLASTHSPSSHLHNGTDIMVLNI